MSPNDRPPLKVVTSDVEVHNDFDEGDETEPGRNQRVTVVQMFRAIKELRADIAMLTMAVQGIVRLMRWCAFGAVAMGLVAVLLWCLR